MRIAEGDRFKHKLTGQLFEVKIIKDDTFILELRTPLIGCGLVKKVWNYFLRQQRERG